MLVHLTQSLSEPEEVGSDDEDTHEDTSMSDAGDSEPEPDVLDRETGSPVGQRGEPTGTVDIIAYIASTDPVVGREACPDPARFQFAKTATAAMLGAYDGQGYQRLDPVALLLEPLRNPVLDLRNHGSVLVLIQNGLPLRDCEGIKAHLRMAFRSAADEAHNHCNNPAPRPIVDIRNKPSPRRVPDARNNPSNSVLPQPSIPGPRALTHVARVEPPSPIAGPSRRSRYRSPSSELEIVEYKSKPNLKARDPSSEVEVVDYKPRPDARKRKRGAIAEKIQAETPVKRQRRDDEPRSTENPIVL
uniref:Uncharacterized protein n=1 Tax=Mycena chlorophos TaxID=658473 RepID=A0ABQ0L3A6_MYCCL|nr:predicted protein [Mycena chlorophos]